MARWRFALALLVAPVAVLYACTSFEGTPAPPVDAGGEGAAGDAAVPFCSTVDASLCLSFDDERELSRPGLKLELSPDAGQVSFSEHDPVSPPKILDITLPSGAVGMNAFHYFHKPAGQLVTCMFHARIDVAGEGEVVIAQLSSSSFVSLGRIWIRKALEIDLEALGPSNAPPSTTPLGTGETNKWMSVMIQVDAENRRLNGSLRGAQASVSLAAVPGDLAITDAFVGLGTFSATGAWRVSFDNLYCTGF